MLVALAACKQGGKVAAHERLGPGAATLRAAFNAAAGKVRVLMLVSPT
jgi:hypothetical protein